MSYVCTCGYFRPTGEELEHLHLPRLGRPVHEGVPLPVPPLQRGRQVLGLAGAQPPQGDDVPGAHRHKELARDGGLLITGPRERNRVTEVLVGWDTENGGATRRQCCTFG